MSASEGDRPVLRVVRGDPTPEELAALVAVVAARSARRAASAGPPRSAWNDPARRVRAPMRPQPGAWRAAALPR